MHGVDVGKNVLSRKPGLFVGFRVKFSEGSCR
jgi:hypothetical protein